jgi:hypothetical protein
VSDLLLLAGSCRIDSLSELLKRFKAAWAEIALRQWSVEDDAAGRV